MGADGDMTVSRVNSCGSANNAKTTEKNNNQVQVPFWKVLADNSVFFVPGKATENSLGNFGVDAGSI